MARFSVKNFFKGINTRINKFRIGSEEAVNTEDVDLSTVELKPQSGLNSNDTTFNSVDYRFKGFDVTDSSSDKFTESGDLLIKSYPDADAKFDRVYYNSSGSKVGLVGQKDLGVPVKPATPTATIVSTGGAGGTALGFSSFETSSYVNATTAPTTDNSSITTLVNDFASGRQFTIFERYGDILCLYDSVNKKLRRVDVTTGNAPAGVNSELPITNGDKVFFSGNYFIGLDANYENATIVEYNTNTETVVSLGNTAPNPRAYNSSNYTPGFSNVQVKDVSVGVNNSNLFVGKNYSAYYTTYQSPQLTYVNNNSARHYPRITTRLDRPLAYIFAGWVDDFPNSYNSIELSPSLDPANSFTTDEGWIIFAGKYEFEAGAPFGGSWRFDEYNTYGKGVMFFTINGVRYTCQIITELTYWYYTTSSGYVYATYYDTIGSNSSTSNSASFYRRDNRWATYILPLDTYSYTSNSTYGGALSINPNPMTGVGSITDQGDHSNGTHTNIPLIEATGDRISNTPNSYKYYSGTYNGPTLVNDQVAKNALATVTVTNNSVSNITITDGGRAWQVGDVFEIPTSNGIPFYGSSSGSNKNIGGSQGVFGVVTSIDQEIEIKVGTNSALKLDFSNGDGQITSWSSGNWGNASGAPYPMGTNFNKDDNQKYFGNITRVNLSSKAVTTKNFSDNVPALPAHLSNFGALVESASGWQEYQSKYPVDNRRDGANYKPNRDNFLLQRKSYDWTTNPASFYDLRSQYWSTASVDTYLLPETHSGFGASTFDVASGDVYKSGTGSSDETLYTSTGGLASGWYTFENVGSPATDDGVIYNPFSTTTVQVYRNVLSAGSTQFGTIQAQLTLANGGYDKVRVDGYNIVYINSAGNGDTISVIDLQNLTQKSGTTHFGYALYAKDAYKEGNYSVIKVTNNQSYIIDNSNNNEIAPVYGGFEYTAKVGTSQKYVYGLTLASNGNAIYLKRQYFFFRHELLGLSVLHDNRNLTTNNRSVNHVLEGYNGSNTTNIYTYLFTHDGGSDFETDEANYFARLDSIRTPILVANLYTVGTFTNSPGTGNVAWNGSNTLSYADNETMHKVQIGDRLTIGSGKYRVSNYPSNTAFTVAHITGEPTQSASASGATQQFTADRYVHRNRYYVLSSTYSGLAIPSSLPTFNNAGGYSGIDEMLSFDGLGSTVKFIPHLSSSSDAYTKSSTYYYAVSLDRNLVDTNNTDIGSDAFTYGGLSIYNSQGANIPFQYRIAYMRDVSHSSETDPFLIEGPVSDESGSVTLNSVLQSIELSGVSGIPNDVTKVRVYRVGGDYARYYWLVDIDVSNNQISTYSDISLDVGSTGITPNLDTHPIPTKLSNIVNANGFFIGSKDSKIYVSEYGNPHSWPTSGEYDIDGEITAIADSQGEAVVFTDNVIYRVRGFNYDEMVLQSIPQSQGVSIEKKYSLTKYLGALYFISNDGLCEFDGSTIKVVSYGNFDKFPEINVPRGAFKDGVLYLFEGSTQSTNKGVKVDFRTGSPVFSRISQKASVRALYNRENDTLYVKDSVASGAYESDQNPVALTHESGVISFGDLDSTKVLFKVTVKYKTNGTLAESGSIQLKDDTGSVFSTLSLPYTTGEYCSYFPLQAYRVLKYMSYVVTGKVTIYEIDFDFEQIESYANKMRFNYVDIQYTGDLKVDLYVDNALQVSTQSYATTGSTNLPSAGGSTRTMRLHFPNNTYGYIPHVYYTGSGRLLSYNYGTESL